MKAAIFKGKGAIELGERPDPTIKEPTDAVVRIVLACVCGSDLWFYRGESGYPVGSPVGHEFLGVVEQVGKSVHTIVKGDLVIAPFLYSDGTCPHCRAGITSACVAGAVWGAKGIDGGRGEAVRVPLADGTIVKVPGSVYSDETLASLITLSDVMCTGHHAAVSAEVKQGDTVAVVGDGAVGLCAIIGYRTTRIDRWGCWCPSWCRDPYSNHILSEC
jgi:threonine dehydrogenase-like Zn-dependent dehydrogenase